MHDTETAKILKGMLTENCGNHFLDSGGANGRHWQRNQGRNFDSELESIVKFDTYTPYKSKKIAADISVTHNVYHWLLGRVEFNPELQAKWENWREGQQKDAQFQSATEFVDELSEGLERTERKLVLDGMRGIYLGQAFVDLILCDRSILDDDAQGDDGDFQALRKGPHHGEPGEYEDAFDRVLNDCRATHEDDDGNLVETCWECEDGDLFEVTSYREPPREIGGIYGEGEPLTVNTYNGEDFLSQVIQFVYWTDDDGEHVLLQIHGGADVRGGYSDAVVFDCNERMGELAILDNARATLYASDGVSWYCDGHTWTCDCGSPLEAYDVVRFEDGKSADGRKLDDVRGTGVLCIDDDGNGYCPRTGGKLQVCDY
tara:strand:- start:2618 stop:3736 length:1119 start_codon:yes stop_codon:yes gene_type:complete